MNKEAAAALNECRKILDAALPGYDFVLMAMHPDPDGKTWEVIVKATFNKKQTAIFLETYLRALCERLAREAPN